jgi:DNA polymerase III gamma/tau subunit
MASLKNKYRPKDLVSVLGNEETKGKLTRLMVNLSVPRAILFEGPTGCGKTTLAWITAGSVAAYDEIRYYNTSNTRGIDTIREIDSNVQYAPTVGENKAYILDECHKITNEGQNALLTLLDEPPSHAYFILCTTQPHRLLKEIRTGRCMRFKVETLELSLMMRLLRSVLIKEKKPHFPKEYMKHIAIRSDGIPRDALTILESVINIKDPEDIGKAIDSVTLESNIVIELCQLLLETRTNRWPEIAKTIRQIENRDAEDARWAVLGYFNKVVLGGKQPDLRVLDMMAWFEQPFTLSGQAGLTQSCGRAFLTK